MRPILMTAPRVQAITFAPDAGDYTAEATTSVTFTINASKPVQWTWSSTGSLPSSSVANGATASSITFTLSNTGYTSKTANISVSAEGKTWTITLTATGKGA